MSTYAGRLVDPYDGPCDAKERGQALDALVEVMQMERSYLAATPDPGREYGYGQRQLELLVERLVLPDHGLTPVAREKALDELRRLLPLPVEERKRLSAKLLKILPQPYLDRAFGEAKDEYRESLAKSEGIEQALVGDVRRKLSKRRSRMKAEGRMKAERRLDTEPALNPALISDGSRAWTVGPLAGSA